MLLLPLSHRDSKQNTQSCVYVALFSLFQNTVGGWSKPDCQGSKEGSLRKRSSRASQVTSDCYRVVTGKSRVKQDQLSVH
ncbi:hypothetical protein Q5P01_017544 [Channa striata]|uniref:Uncharacterized protein n=1 Tax=Channa striata TaxID=64152 RepID=A0AA88M9M9_CHASR|nr:hypothetical protein Q5P01_017544 [Channa striata]